MRILLGALGLGLLTVVLAISTGASASPLPPAGWEAADTLGQYYSADFYRIYPQVAMDPGGNATAVWEAPAGGHMVIWASRFTLKDGWGPASVIGRESGNASHPEVKMDDRGNALVIWQIDDGVSVQLWTNYFTSQTDWGDPERVDTDLGNATEFAVAFDGGGIGIALWRVRGPTTEYVMTCRYAPATGWGSRDTLDSSSTYLSGPDIGADSSGNAIAIWARYQAGIGWDAVARRYTPFGGWGAVIPLESSTWTAGDLHLAMSSDGNATVVFVQFDGTNWNGYAVNYIVSGPFGAGWSASPALIETSSDDVIFLTLAAGPGGRAAAAWYQRGDAIVNLYDPGVGWTGPTQVNTDPNPIIFPALAYSDSGVVTAVWEGYEAPPSLERNIWSSAFVPQRGWSSATKIETMSGLSESAQVATDRDGRALAVWTTFEWTNPDYVIQVAANLYTPADFTPPLLNLTGPLSGTVTTTPTVQVTGRTEPGAAVVINGVQASVSANGTFALRLALALGVNTITVTARDAWGNAVSAFSSVTYTDPSAQLQPQLDARWAELNATEAELAATRALLNATSSALNRTAQNLNATQAELDQAQSDLTAAQQRIVATDDELNVTQLDLRDVTTELTNTKADLSTARGDLGTARTQINLTQGDLARTRDDLARVQTDLNATRIQLAAASAGVERTTKEVDQARADAASAQSLVILVAIIAFAGVGLGAASAVLALRAGKAAAASAPPKIRTPPPPPPAFPPPSGGVTYYPQQYPPNRPY